MAEHHIVVTMAIDPEVWEQRVADLIEEYRSDSWLEAGGEPIDRDLAEIMLQHQDYWEVTGEDGCYPMANLGSATQEIRGMVQHLQYALDQWAASREGGE